jgi:hypothetical protein
MAHQPTSFLSRFSRVYGRGPHCNATEEGDHRKSEVDIPVTGEGVAETRSPLPAYYSLLGPLSAGCDDRSCGVVEGAEGVQHCAVRSVHLEVGY